MAARHPSALGNQLRCALVACGLVLLLAPAGCTRTRPVTPTPAAGNPTAISATVDPAAAAANPSAADSSAADSSATVPTAAPVIVEVTAPTDGASVGSPIPIAGSALVDPSRQLAAQVFSQGSDSSRAWRGNGLLAVQGDGRFEGTIAYTLDEAGPGVVEIAVVDATSGAVYERRSIPVQLAAAP
jgi:hypothetical protein